MLYARFMYPDSGYDYDVEYAEKTKLEVGKRYEVVSLSMGQSHTFIHLKDVGDGFNSVQFDFEEEDGTSVNIYKDPRYNPYMQY